MKLARSWLFVPGDSARKFERALQGESDAVILDWEDGVASGAKAYARAATVSALAVAKHPSSRLWIRVNALRSAWFADDLAALPAGAIAGVVLPKACGPADVERLSRDLDAVEARAGISPGSLGIVAIVTETAASVLALSEFRRPVPRLTAIMWGGEDLAGDLGVACNRDQGGSYRAPFQLARCLTLLAAAAAECGAVDAVCVDIRDIDALAVECTEARADGFSAKAAIHPDQVDIINRTFTANADERAWAQLVVAALRETGLAVVDGKMVDAPHLRLALRILSS